jgi:hypothetical protein
MNKSHFLQGLLLLVFLFSVTTRSRSQDEKLKAIFVYNFTKYINWPQKPGNFVIVVLGKSAIYTEIESIASKKTVGNAAIQVINTNSPEEIMDSHIIYIPASKTNLLLSILRKSQEQHILIITEKEGSCKTGSCINFYNKDGKLGFEISKTNIENYGLGVSTDLLKLGTVIKE